MSSLEPKLSDPPGSRRQPDLYGRQLAQLKAASICIRLYRNRLGRRVRAVELMKAIGSGGAIAGWVIWKDWPLLWAGIIAAAQFLDATKHVFPYARMHRSACELTVALELLCVDAEAEWEGIHAGKISDAASPNGGRGSPRSSWRPSTSTSRTVSSLGVR